MKYSSFFSTLALFAATASAEVQGFDISHWQETVDFTAAYNTGNLRFVYIKATESTTYRDPSFSSHYTGATDAGFIRGAYHFAQPEDSTGAEQADYFIAHGGGWSNDGITLPGMLDLEAGCSGLSTAEMVAWIKSFSDRYHAVTGRYPALYTNLSWWTECTGNSEAFSSTNPLVLARWASTPGTIPGGWPYQTIWQYKDSNPYGGDSDVFNGDLTQLRKLATG